MTNSKVALGCLTAFLLPFCGVGVVTAFMALRSALAGDWGQAGFLSIFALVFGGVGFGMLAAAWRGRHRVAAIDQRRAAHPDEPWLWRPEWAAGRIESSTRQTMIASAAFAALWNLIALPGTLAALPQYLDTREPQLLLVLIFPVVGTGLIAWAVRAAARYRKYGVSILELAHVPGVVGRGIGGIVRVSVPLAPDRGFAVKLTCVNRYTSGAGKNRSTSERILWQETRTATDFEREWSGRGTRVPVVFRLPSDVRESDDRDPNNRIIWRLQVDADVPGVDYHAQFDVPVFRTAESDAPLTEDAERALAQAASREEYQQPADSPIRVTPAPGGIEVHFPMARNIAPALFTTAFTAVWSAGVYFLYRSDAPGFFWTIFGLFDVLMIYVVLLMWLGHSRIRIGRERIVVTRGIAFLTRSTSMPTASLSEVSIKIGMRSGNTPYYDLTLRGADGEKLKAASSIKSKREAEWVADRIRKACAIEGRGVS
ncbi:MAG: hypothetical protein O7I93_17185 [Gemmatimonadetes bacterium]|nr:hypothetical protein [Gemmatimonadota bacterium]